MNFIKGSGYHNSGGPAEQLLVPMTELKNYILALANVAQWTECQPTNQRVPGLIPSQGTCLGYRPGSPVGGMQEATTH